MKPTLARRKFLSLTAGAVAGVLVEDRAASAVAIDVPVQAVVFDAFPIFDPRPIFALAEDLFPGRGAELGKAWRTRQFEYTWLRTVAGRYADFWRVTEDALIFAARDLKLDLDSQRRARLMNAYLELKAWPDVPQALESLKATGTRLAFLSNFSRRMLEAGINNSGLEGVFEQLLSTDNVK
jgi:2-haloacid dehalogenase